MEIETRTTDRTALIDFLKEETGLKAQYLGAPGFRYVVGPYTVLRNANILTDDASGKKLLPDLENRGFVEETEEEQGIAIPMDPEAVRPKMNLLNMVAARGQLISKALGMPNALHASKPLIRSMQKANPADLAGFREAMAAGHADTELRGLKIYSDKAVFTGFPLDGPDANAARELAEAMVRTAEKQRWVKPDVEKPENEKYAFRVWLLTLGMKGKKYAETRNRLLERLDGDAAYRTADQKEAAMKKRSTERRKEEPHEEFTVL